MIVKRKKRQFLRKKICRFCTEHIDLIDYKDIKRIRGLVTERGKIIPRRISGNCAKHQRMLTSAIKRARNIALLPFTVERQ
jgi:small subunit ribosomal protein S18